MIYGIDVSKYNTILSWNKVKSSGKQFVIIRLGWINWNGTITVDTKFESHYRGAINAGLDVGIYVYSYLKDSKYAIVAAQNTIKLLQNKCITYPVMFDIEEHKIAQKLTKTQNTQICKAFLQEVQDLGYFAMLYTYTSFINAYLNIRDLSAFGLWVADYREQTGTNCPYKNAWGIWQYKGDTGRCDGVVGACDLNISKYDYAKIIKSKGLNKYKPQVEIITDDIWFYTDVNKNVVTNFRYDKHANVGLSNHFKVKEFASKNGKVLYSNEVKIHNKLIQILEELYSRLNCGKIIVTSGYRTSLHDKKVGGNGKGYHTKGMACDIVCYDKLNNVISSKVVCRALEDMSVYGIGYISETATHIDTRSKRYKWYGDESKNKTISSFRTYFK